MNTSCRAFVDALIQHSAEMQVVYRETLDYWSPDEPPLTTLFAALGDQIVLDFDRVKNEVNRAIFRQIESAMVSGDEQLITAVATGLIESIVAKASLEMELRQQVLPMFGEQSHKHVVAWIGT